MSEKITRAQAEAALEELEDLAVCGHNEEAASRHTIRNIASMVRAYLAQQPSDDVVRKAHGALDTMHETWCNCCSECQTEGGPLAEAILAALPPMPEEK